MKSLAKFPIIRNEISGRKVLIIVLVSTYPIIFLLQILVGPYVVKEKLGLAPLAIIQVVFILQVLTHFTSSENRGQIKTFLSSLSKSKVVESQNESESKISVFVSFFLLSLFSLIYFTKEHDQFFAGTDGALQLSLNKSHLTWNDSPFFFGNNFLQGLGGNLPFPFNHRIDPGYVIGSLSEEFNQSIALTLWFLILAFSIYALARSLKLNRKNSIFACWFSSIVIVLPSGINFTLIPTLTPHMMTTIAVNNLLMALVLVNPMRTITNLARFVMMFMLSLYYLISNPTFILLSAPVIFMTILARLSTLETGNKRKHGIGVFLTFSSVALIGGLIYIFGIFFYSSIFFFHNEHIGPTRTLKEVSLLFSARPLVSLLMLIIIYVGFKYSKNKTIDPIMAKVSMYTSLYAISIAVMGIVFHIFPGLWRGPSLFYFEFMSWSLYGIIISQFILSLLSFKLNSLNGNKLSKRFSIILLSPYFLIFLLSIYFIGKNTGVADYASKSKANLYESQSSILNFLEKVMNQNDSIFNGRVYTVWKYQDQKRLSWGEVDLAGRELFENYGTDFRQATMWYRNIPTLWEVNQLITPRSYYLLTRTLGREGDAQSRDFVLVRDIQLATLQNIGVKYVISDNELPLGNLVMREKKNTITIFLYEIPDTNLGQYFASNFVELGNGKSQQYVRDILRSTTSKKVIVEKNISIKNLVRPSASSLRFDGGSYFYKASSAGISLGVLPFEYSKCFEIKSVAPDYNFEIFPVNIGLTGILFRNQVDLELKYAYGPFKNATCRTRDFLDFRNTQKFLKDS